MACLRILTVAVLIWTASWGPASAQDVQLQGAWSGKASILLELDGQIVKVPRILSLVIETVDGQLLVGYRKWQAITDDPGNVAGVDVLSATEPFIGIIDSDGVTLRLVETDDPGVMIGEVLGVNSLEITYLEPYPHAVAYTVIMTRQAE